MIRDRLFNAILGELYRICERFDPDHERLTMLTDMTEDGRRRLTLVVG